MILKLFKKIFVFIFFLFIGYIYLHNLTRDIYGGDIGDLVTAAYVFGVAHPPGYPLFSLIGFIFSHLPINLPVVSRVGLISVISSLAGLIIYYKFCQKITKNSFISLLSTSILAFSYFYWLTAEIPEGLALNNFFVIVILFLAIRFYERKKTKDLYLLALFIALSLTHQLFIVTLFPAIFILIIKHYKFIFSNKKIFLISGLWFLAGLTVYIYVPIAASRNPPINWDNAVNLKNFLHLVLRKDYGGISYGSKNVTFQVRMINVSHYLKTIISVFSYQILFVAFLGFIKLFKIDKRLSITILLAFLLTGVITIFINAGIIFSDVHWAVAERYYSTSAVVLMLVVPFGFLLIKNFLNSKFSKSIYSYLILSYFLIIPFLLFKYNFPKTDLSKTHIGYNLAQNIFLSLPKNSVLLTSGDNMTFDLWYSYYVLGERNDVTLINSPLIGNNIFINKVVNDYYINNPKADLNKIIFNTLGFLIRKKKVYTTNQLVFMPKDTILIPRGIIYEIADKSDLPNEKQYINSVEAVWKNIKIKKRKDLSSSEENFLAIEIPSLYAQGFVRIGDFLYTYYNNPKKASDYYRKAILIDDTLFQAYSSLAMSVYKSDKNCIEALQYIKQAISLYPVWEQYYSQQYYISKNCQINKNILNKLKLDYQLHFKKNIDK